MRAHVIAFTASYTSVFSHVSHQKSKLPVSTSIGENKTIRLPKGDINLDLAVKLMWEHAVLDVVEYFVIRVHDAWSVLVPSDDTSV
jgi:hypothetical protein